MDETRSALHVAVPEWSTPCNASGEVPVAHDLAVRGVDQEPEEHRFECPLGLILFRISKVTVTSCSDPH